LKIAKSERAGKRQKKKEEEEEEEKDRKEKEKEKRKKEKRKKKKKTPGSLLVGITRQAVEGHRNIQSVGRQSV
jgi:hypothetical protein